MVSLKELRKSFDATEVLRGISLEVNHGEIVAIMGSSGGGKTTLLRCISGLLKPSSGEILVDDVDVQKSPEEARRHMGMVFQSAALFDYMDVRANVLFGIRRQLRLSPKEQNQAANQALERVGLQDDASKMPAELSGGMKKRVGIARAIALNPKVMLYDEPTSALDPIMSDKINDLILDLRSKLNMTSIVVTHDMSSAYKIADKIAMIYEGKIIFSGTPAEIRASRNPYIQQFIRGQRKLYYAVDEEATDVTFSLDNLKSGAAERKFRMPARKAETAMDPEDPHQQTPSE